MEIPYAVAAARHPDAVAEVMESLRRGKSVHREAPPDTLLWSYRAAVRGRSYSLGEILSRVPEAPLEPLEQRTTVNLEGRVGRWAGCSKVLPGIPPEVREAYHIPAPEGNPPSDP